MKKLPFKPGDKVVYPKHGPGVVEALREQTIAGEVMHFIEINIVDCGMKVMVPIAQMESVGLRKIVDKGAIDRVYNILQDRKYKVDNSTWNRRYREYTQKLNTGSVFEIAEIIRDLAVLGGDKELSYGEKRMMELAQKRLASEIAIARSKTQDAVIGELQELCAA